LLQTGNLGVSFNTWLLSPVYIAWKLFQEPKWRTVAAGEEARRAGDCAGAWAGKARAIRNYMRGIAEKAWAAGFHVVRLNQRIAAGRNCWTPTLYNSGMSGDYRACWKSWRRATGSKTDIFCGIRWEEIL